MTNTSTKTFIAVTSVYDTRLEGKGKAFLRRPGEQVQLSTEDAERLLDRGAVREVKSEDQPETNDESSERSEPLPRPSASASKEDWRNYAASLPGGGPQLSDDAKRDEIIAAVDAHQAQHPRS